MPFGAGGGGGAPPPALPTLNQLRADERAELRTFSLPVLDAPSLQGLQAALPTGAEGVWLH